MAQGRLVIFPSNGSELLQSLSVSSQAWKLFEPGQRLDNRDGQSARCVPSWGGCVASPSLKAFRFAEPCTGKHLSQRTMYSSSSPKV